MSRIMIDLKRSEKTRKALFYANKVLYYITVPIMVLPALLFQFLAELFMYIPSMIITTAAAMRIEEAAYKLVVSEDGLNMSIDEFKKMDQEDLKSRLDRISLQKFMEIVDGKNSTNS